jgi:hypothetical protein
MSSRPNFSLRNRRTVLLALILAVASALAAALLARANEHPVPPIRKTVHPSIITKNPSLLSFR